MAQARRLSGRQVTAIVIAVCAAVVATPAMVWAAAGSFSSGSTTPAVTGTNTSGTWPASGVYGKNTATSGSGIGVLGSAASSGGYGVYSSGRLGIKVAAGQPPIVVSSGAGQATNLNSSMVDGRQVTTVWKEEAANTAETTVATFGGFRLTLSCDSGGNPVVTGYPGISGSLIRGVEVNSGGTPAQFGNSNSLSGQQLFNGTANNFGEIVGQYATPTGHVVSFNLFADNTATIGGFSGCSLSGSLIAY